MYLYQGTAFSRAANALYQEQKSAAEPARRLRSMIFRLNRHA